MMNESRFMDRLAIYGADLSRWPEADRAEAEVLLRKAPHRIKDIWESERSFDGLLALEADSPASLQLEARILSSSPAPSSAARTRHVLSGFRIPRWATGAIAASLALGFALGYTGEPQHPVDAPSLETPQMLIFAEDGSAVLLLSGQVSAE
jgi:hypothetical protein